MANRLLHVRPKLAECAMVFDHFKQRIVAEPVTAGRLKANSAAAHIVAFSANPAFGVGDRNMAYIPGRAFFVRRIAEIGKQATIVRLIRCVRPGITCRIYAGRTTKRIDFQAAVVRQYPAVQMLSLLPSLQYGVRGK